MNPSQPKNQKTNIVTARLLQLSTDFTNAQTERFQKEAALKAIQSIARR